MTNHTLTAQQLESIWQLRDAIQDPRQGLPDAIFEFALGITPMINVDILIQEEAGVLLAWREDRWGTGWHVVGGIIRFDETVSDRIRQTASTELQSEVEFDPAPIAITQFFAARGHFISLLFSCRLLSRLSTVWHPADGPPSPGAIGWFSRIPEQIYPAHLDYIPRLPLFAPANPLSLAETPIRLK